MKYIFIVLLFSCSSLFGVCLQLDNSVCQQLDTLVIQKNNKDSRNIIDKYLYHESPLDMSNMVERRIDESGNVYFNYSIDDTPLSGLTFTDSLFYNPLFAFPYFKGYDTSYNLFDLQNKMNDFKEVLVSPQKTFKPLLSHLSFINEVRMKYSKDFPGMINFSFLDSYKKENQPDNFQISKNPIVIYNDNRNTDLDSFKLVGIPISNKLWFISGESSFQFSQNYYSDNWYKGGISNFDVRSYQTLNLNYKHKKVKFNNVLEWRLSAYSTLNDSITRYRVGEDLLRYYGDFGIESFLENGYYSFNAEVKTQSIKSYMNNRRELKSAFLSPLYITSGIGFRYEIDQKSKTVWLRRFRMSLSLYPISLNYLYLKNENIPKRIYGIDEDKKYILNLGFSAFITLNYNINSSLSWKSRFKVFANFSRKTELEFENVIDLALSKYFSTRLFLTVRYDNKIPPDPKFKYFQINEILSFGFNYKF